MGGTFDPVHFGHLVAAEAARHAFNLERVIFVPSGLPPHKAGEHVSDSEHRYLMTVLATIDNPRFAVSRLEIDRPGYSYTVDTVRQLLRLSGPDTDLFFITGADAVLEILTWKEPDNLLRLCRFVAATRPGYPPEQLIRLGLQLKRQHEAAIEPLEVPALAISSSDIRQRVREGRPIRYLVPRSVEHYIIRHGLYSNHAAAPMAHGEVAGTHDRQGEGVEPDGS